LRLNPPTGDVISVELTPKIIQLLCMFPSEGGILLVGTGVSGNLTIIYEDFDTQHTLDLMNTKVDFPFQRAAYAHSDRSYKLYAAFSESTKNTFFLYIIDYRTETIKYIKNDALFLDINALIYNPLQNTFFAQFGGNKNANGTLVSINSVTAENTVILKTPKFLPKMSGIEINADGKDLYCITTYNAGGNYFDMTRIKVDTKEIKEDRFTNYKDTTSPILVGLHLVEHKTPIPTLED